MSKLKKLFLMEIQKLRQLLSSGADPNTKFDKYGTTSLHLASSPEIALELIKFGADIDARDAFGQTPLCCAVSRGNLEIVKVLLSNGANVNVKMGGGITPLHIAPNVELTNLLLSHGAEVNIVDSYGRTPIHSALIDGKAFDVFKALIQAGSNVNIKMARFDNSLLHYADSLEVTRELLEHGAKVNAEKIDGQTPLHCALRHMKKTEVVRELLKWGARVNARDNESETALGLAMRCYNKNYSAIKELVKYGGDINFEMFDCSLISYCTIIESAVHNDLPCAKLLVKMYLLMNWDGNSNVQIEFNSRVNHDNVIELLRHKDDCVSEIIQLKSDKMFLKYTLYELILQKEKIVKPIYGSYRAIKTDIESKYPIYQDLIMEEVEKGLERGRLLTRLEQFYSSIKFCNSDDEEMKLNSDCLLMIARYLSDSDILSIIMTFEECFYHP